jgi:RNA polymerase-binding transcription factor DksA
MSQHSRIARTKAGQAARISAERESLRVRLAALDRGKAFRDRGEIGGDNTPTSDTLDTAQESMAKEEALAARDALIQRIKVFARAEEKIREGTYGLCEACGRPIPAARLRALPEAVLCVPCAEAQERRPMQRR